eukprot:2692507-Prymnesium_polylepis.1
MSWVKRLPVLRASRPTVVRRRAGAAAAVAPGWLWRCSVSSASMLCSSSNALSKKASCGALSSCRVCVSGDSAFFVRNSATL